MRDKKQIPQGLFVLKASEKLFKPDALGAYFGLVFPCWQSWGHTGVLLWDGCKREPTKVSPLSWEKVPGPLLGQEGARLGEQLGLGASPLCHLEPLESDHTPAVNSSFGAPRLSCA